MTDETSAALGRIKAALDYKHRHVQLTEAQAREALAHIAALEARAEAAEAKVAAAEERGLVFNMLPDGRLDFCAIREGSRLWDGRVRAEAAEAREAELRAALEKARDELDGLSSMRFSSGTPPEAECLQDVAVEIRRTISRVLGDEEEGR